ncbi:MAG TPA: response regulator transcription factor [Bryobacteraceae bacterium]|nr:response regulator transcription factor [Bryobacteraceae bacterium]
MRILIADDHMLFRHGIQQLFAMDRTFEVVGEASNGAEAVDRCLELRPDVVVMDVSMPGISSFDACRQIRRARPDTRILFLSMFDDEDCLMRALESGASGYVVKDTSPRELMAAVVEVARGGTFLSPKLLTHLVEDFRGRVKNDGKVPRFSTLTPRESEVLKLLAEGRCVKEIATDLKLSSKTVEAHKFNLMRKLDLHSNAQLIHYAFQNKIVQLAAVPA